MFKNKKEIEEDWHNLNTVLTDWLVKSVIPMIRLDSNKINNETPNNWMITKINITDVWCCVGN